MHFWDPSQWDKMCFECQRIKFQWKKDPPLTVSLTVLDASLLCSPTIFSQNVREWGLSSKPLNFDCLWARQFLVKVYFNIKTENWQILLVLKEFYSRFSSTELKSGLFTQGASSSFHPFRRLVAGARPLLAGKPLHLLNCYSLLTLNKFPMTIFLIGSLRKLSL